MAVFVLVAAGATYVLAALCTLTLRWFDPPSTAVQIERHIHAWSSNAPYEKRYEFVSSERISQNLKHAVIAAEDARFYQHHGFDWKEMRAAMDKALDGGKPRGASTITQQLVRNLFLSTEPSLLRKCVEATLVPLAEVLLGKQRILELYLNVVEWGRGIYGVQAASQYYFQKNASRLTREQAVQLAALLPAPLHRRPGQVEWYAAKIRARMSAMGW